MEAAQRQEPGAFYQRLACLVFAAFTVEAYLNHVGVHIFSVWDDLKRLSSFQKLRVIADKLSMTIEPNARPYSTIQDLVTFRNKIAHGRSFQLVEGPLILDVTAIDPVEYEKAFYDMPESDWEKYCTLQNATDAVTDVRAAIESIHEHAKIKGDLLFMEDWSGSAETLSN